MRILTNTPVRNSVAEGFAAKKRKKEKVQSKAKKYYFDLVLEGKNHLLHPRKVMGLWSFAKSDDANVTDDEELTEKNFVIVKLVSAKSRIARYIARIDAMDENEFEWCLFKTRKQS